MRLQTSSVASLLVPRVSSTPLILVDRSKQSEGLLRTQQAKDYLVSQVVEQALLENVPLSEVERKMLYFTETEETGADMLELNDQFEREYDTPTYEKKISGLLHNAFQRVSRENPDGELRWKEAVAELSNGDHYILVMVDQAKRSIRPPGDQLKLLISGIAVAGALVGVSFLTAKHNVDLDKYLRPIEWLRLIVWGTAAGIAIVYTALRLLLDRQRMDNLYVKIVEAVFAPASRKNNRA